MYSTEIQASYQAKRPVLAHPVDPARPEAPGLNAKFFFMASVAIGSDRGLARLEPGAVRMWEFGLRGRLESDSTAWMVGMVPEIGLGGVETGIGSGHFRITKAGGTGGHDRVGACKI